MVQRVKKGDPITAAAWNEMAAAINNNLAARGGSIPPRPVPITITNRTNANAEAGSVLTVYKGGTYTISSLSPDDARKAWLNNGFQLDGYASGTGGVPALLVDSIPAGKVGRAILPGLCAGFLTNVETVPDTCKFDPANGVFTLVSSGETGDWKIIADSAKSSGRVFCYLIPLGGGGGGTVYIAPYASQSAGINSNTIYLTGIALTQSGGSAILTAQKPYLQNAAADGTLTFITDVNCDTSGNLLVTSTQTKLLFTTQW